MFYIGLMSGTSVDGIDAALVAVNPIGSVTIRATHHHPYPPELQQAVHELTRSGAATLDQLGMLDRRLGEAFAQAAQGLLAHSGVRSAEIRAIGSHGQTIRHRPDTRPSFSMQLGHPAVIAELTGITTVADFRARDMAAGGQGAPLVPAFHAVQFHSPDSDRVILNIGGIANITWLPSDQSKPIAGFDTGPGNTLLDQWIMRHRGERFDRDGNWAASGKVQEKLLAQLLADPYFSTPPPKSTGREHFHLGWLDRHLAAVGEKLPAEDVQATLVALTARSIAQALTAFALPVRELYACGGGVHNRALMTALKEQLRDTTVNTTERLGVPSDAVEAAAFAWLAHQALEGRPGNLPSVTGARHPAILGGIYRA
jgi:anhydro-N-acetylmuramic acid kinase